MSDKQDDTSEVIIAKVRCHPSFGLKCVFLIRGSLWASLAAAIISLCSTIVAYYGALP